MTRIGLIAGCVWVALSAACSDYTGSGPDPGKAGITEGRRVVILVQNLYANALAVDDTRLYASTGMGVESFAKNGTDEQLIATTKDNGGNATLVLWKDYLFLRGPSGGVVSIPKSGGKGSQIVDSAQAPGQGGIAVDDSGLYYVSQPNLVHVAFPSGSPEVLASDANSNGPQSGIVAVDANNVYYGSSKMNPGGGPNQGVLKSIAKIGHAVTELVTTTGQIGAVVAHNGVVYFVDSTSSTSPSGSLGSVDPNSGNVTVIDDTIDPNIASGTVMAVDDQAVYLSTVNGIQSFGIGTTIGTTTLAQASKPNALVVDDTWVYWIDQNSNGWILKVRK